jgi:hypothetical protein
MTPDDPRHGKRSGYLAGCKDPCCRIANFRDVKARRLRVLREGPQRVDPAPVAEVLRYWYLRGVNAHAIAAAAGIAADSLHTIWNGGQQRILLSNLRKVLAVTEDDLPPTTLVYADLSRTRIFSMMAAGHPLVWICDQLPSLLYGGKWRTQERMKVGAAREIRDLYNRTSSFGPSPFTAARARGTGYLLPAAWDDPGTLTMPRGWKPTGATAPVTIDEAAVERRLAGDKSIRLHRGETAEVARRLLLEGKSTTAIARDYGIKAERYVKVAEIRQGAAA